MLSSALLVPWAALAQAGFGFPAVELERVEAPEPGKLRLFITEVDARGVVPSEDLSTPAFALFVDDREVAPAGARFERFERANQRMTVVFVVQLGGTASEVFPAVKDALITTTKSIGASTSVGVVAYAGRRVVLEVAPTEPASLVRQLEKLEDATDAEQYFVAAHEKALAFLRADGVSGARKVVVVLSDGLWSDPDERAAANAGRALLDLGARAHVLGLESFPNEVASGRLRRLAQAARGTLRTAQSAAQVAAQLDAITTQLRMQHLVDVELPELFDGGNHQLEVRLRADGAKSQPLSVNVGKQWVSTWSAVRLPLLVGVVVVLLAGGALAFTTYRRRALAASLKAPPSGRPAISTPGRPGPPSAPGVPPPSVSGSRPPIGTPATAPVPEADATIMGIDVRGAGGARAATPQVTSGPAAPPPMEDDTIPPYGPSGHGGLPVDPSLADPHQILAASGAFNVPSILSGGSGHSVRSPLDARPSLDARPALGAVVPQELDALPSPTQFLQLNAMGSLEDVTSTEPLAGPPTAPTPVVSLPTEDVAPTIAISVQEMRAHQARAERPAPAEVVDHPARSIGVSIDPGPSTGVAVEPLSRPVLEGLSGIIGARKTHVVDLSELRQADTIAWVTYLDGELETQRLVVGDELGGRALSLSLEGRWLLGGAPIGIGDTVLSGDRMAVFGCASRFPAEQAAQGPYLRVIGGLDDGRIRPLETEAPLVIGCDASAGLVVRGPGVERRHVVVVLDGGALEVVDLGTKAGFRIGRDTARRARIELGGELAVGGVRLQFLRPGA